MKRFNKGLLGTGLLVPLAIAGCGGGGSDGGSASQPPANQAPIVARVNDQTVDEDGIIGPLSLAVSDPETPASALTVSARAKDPTLLPDGGVEVLGSGAERMVFLTPAEEQSGNTQVSVDVTDPSGARSSTTFAVDVQPLFRGEFSGWMRSVVAPRDSFDEAVGELHEDGTPLTGPEDIPRIKFSDDSAEDPTAYDDLLPVEGVAFEDE